MSLRPLVLALAATAPALLPAQDAPLRSVHHQYRVVTVAEGLANPWSMAFLPGGDMLVTERSGRLRVIRGGRLLAEPVAGLPAIRVGNQGGLLEVAAHPDFARNRLLYLTYAKPNAAGDQSTTAVIRARLENNALTDVQEIFEANAWSRGQGHYGSRLAFDGKGHIFITVGDRQVPPQGDLEKHAAQDLSVHNGKVIRLHEDGRVPADNPFVGREGALPQIWSYGHRNPQGLLIDAAGNVWVTEHGPQGGDELNLVQPGKNYGWPVIGFGVNYRTGTNIHSGTTRAGMEQPLKVWVPSIATSGLMQYNGGAFSGWQGHVFAGGLVGEVLWRLKIEDGRVTEEEQLLTRRGRIRDVRQGPDGFIYVAIEDRMGAPTSILRLEPAGR